MKKYVMLVVAFFACNNLKENSKIMNFLDCQFLQIIPNENYSPYNPDWIIYIDGKRFQVKEIEKYKSDLSIDSLYIIKSDFVLDLL